LARDFFAIYTFARVPMTGRSPYEMDAVNYDHPVFRDAARDHFRWLNSTAKSHTAHDRRAEPVSTQRFGLVYPPQAYLVFYPFSRLRWFPALACWTLLMTLAALACGNLIWTFDLASQGRSPTNWALVSAAILLNPVTELHLAQGQTTLLLCAGVALGQWVRRYGYFWLAAFFWSFAAIKPQLGILLCGLTLFVGGWRFCVATAIMTVALNILGGLVTTGDPLMILDVWNVTHAHIGHYYNTVRNPDITSWFRAVYVLTGSEIAMTPARNLAGLCLWAGSVLGSARIRGGAGWDLPYWLATATVGSLLCGLSHAYDLVMLTLLLPYICWLYDRGYDRDWFFLTVLVVVAVLIPMSVPRALASRLTPGVLAEMLASHRTFVVLVLAAYLLIRGQPRGATVSHAG
jgi:hypothetical protein